MASKKRRPIVMNRNKAPGRTYVILKRVLAITAVLALIEVVILVVLHFKNEIKSTALSAIKTQTIPKATATEIPKDTPKEVPKEAPKVIPNDTLKEVVKDTATTAPVIEAKKIEDKKPVELVVKKDTVATKKTLAVKSAPVAKKLAVDTTVKPVAKAEIKVVNKVTDEKMQEILNELRTQKTQGNNAARCVSIQIVSNSNAENGSRIANYLRKNGYVISGREVVQGEQKGIQINASGTCIKLAVGDL